MSQPRRCFLLVRSQQELVDHTTLGKDLRLTYAINHAKMLRNLPRDSGTRPNSKVVQALCSRGRVSTVGFPIEFGECIPYVLCSLEIH